MTFRQLHGWDVTPAQARAIQRRLGPQVVHNDEADPVRRVARRVSLPTAIAHVLACCPRYRVPEPMRAARRAAAES